MKTFSRSLSRIAAMLLPAFFLATFLLWGWSFLATTNVIYCGRSTTVRCNFGGGLLNVDIQRFAGASSSDPGFHFLVNRRPAIFATRWSSAPFVYTSELWRPLSLIGIRGYRYRDMSFLLLKPLDSWSVDIPFFRSSC